MPIGFFISSSIDDVYQQILVGRFEMLHNNGIVIKEDPHFVQFHDTNAVMKGIYTRLFDSPK